MKTIRGNSGNRKVGHFISRFLGDWANIFASGFFFWLRIGLYFDFRTSTALFIEQQRCARRKRAKSANVLVFLEQFIWVTYCDLVSGSAYKLRATLSWPYVSKSMKPGNITCRSFRKPAIMNPNWSAQSGAVNRLAGRSDWFNVTRRSVHIIATARIILNVLRYIFCSVLFYTFKKTFIIMICTRGIPDESLPF